MASPRRFELVRCYLPTNRLPYSYVTQEGFGRTAEEARVHAGWELKPVEGEELSTVFVEDNPIYSDKDSVRIAHELVTWSLDPKSDVPETKRQALIAILKKKLYAQALEYFYNRIVDAEGLETF